MQGETEESHKKSVCIAGFSAEFRTVNIQDTVRYRTFTTNFIGPNHMQLVKVYEVFVLRLRLCTRGDTNLNATEFC